MKNQTGTVIFFAPVTEAKQLISPRYFRMLGKAKISASLKMMILFAGII